MGNVHRCRWAISGAAKADEGYVAFAQSQGARRWFEVPKGRGTLA
jgi:hypothetical protein